MKRTVSETEYYQIKIDAGKNRMYITLKGVWRAPENTPLYVQNVTKATKMLRPDFTLLVNFSMLLPFPENVWNSVHGPAMNVLIQEGLKKSSQILPRNEETTALLEKYAQKSKLSLTAFGDEEIAELFLEN